MLCVCVDNFDCLLSLLGELLVEFCWFKLFGELMLCVKCMYCVVVLVFDMFYEMLVEWFDWYVDVDMYVVLNDVC